MDKRTVEDLIDTLTIGNHAFEFSTDYIAFNVNGTTFTISVPAARKIIQITGRFNCNIIDPYAKRIIPMEENLYSAEIMFAFLLGQKKKFDIIWLRG